MQAKIFIKQKMEHQLLTLIRQDPRMAAAHKPKSPVTSQGEI